MSWAWRSFLSRPHPLLLCSLRPVRRHGSQLALATLSGRNKLIGSRGYASDSSGDATTKRHLYVVLDDHMEGFGIHKLNLSGNDDNDLDSGVTRRLTERPVLLVVRTTLGDRVRFAAVGSSIVATGDTIISPRLADRWIPNIGGVLIYDTKTTALTVTAHLPIGLMGGGYKAAMAVGNSLYMLSTGPPSPPWGVNDEGRPAIDWDNCGGTLHSLTTDPLDPVDSEGDKYWGWQLLSDSSPWIWSHFESPPMVPFWAEHITAYGGHATHASTPGAMVQHELLVSLRSPETSVLGATFSFNSANREWRRLGVWHIPVVGHVHYDCQLDAWIGFHAVNDGSIDGPHVTDGHLCVGKDTSAPSEWKVGKDKLFRLDEDNAAGWRHVDAKLVLIASGEGHDDNEYCLMERLRRKGDVNEDKEGNVKGEEKECWGQGRKCLLRFSTFRIERGQDGEPMVMACRPALSYEVSQHSRHFDAQAFWM